MSRIDVAYVARLAGLELTKGEMELFQPQLEEIVKTAARISEVDTGGVEPMVYGCDCANAMRDDEPAPSMPREAALANAPSSANGEFVLPKIVEGAES